MPDDRPPRERGDDPPGKGRGPRPGGSRPGAGRSGRPGGRPTGRPGGRPSGGRPSGARPGGRPDGRPGGRPGRGRPGGVAGRRPARDERPEQPRTEAERRAAEVRARRQPRPPVDPDVERQRIEQRETERWVDEGSIRAEAQAATARAAGGERQRHAVEVDPEVVAQIHGAAPDPGRAARLTERLTAASAALDRERFDDVRRMVAPLLRELPQVAAGHELNGLACYRTGRWREAAASLEQARQLRADPALLPVLADCYRALKRWTAVENVWREIREMSPPHEVMAEGRIVVAGAHADRGELREAIAVMQPAQKPPKKVREYHLRQWYVLADLLDRAGDTMGATRWFREVRAHDPDFADVRDRLRSLGR